MNYLDKLLEGVEVEWKNLGEVYKFQYGKGNTIPKSGGKYPVYGSNGIVGSHSEYNSEDSPVIGHIGAYAGIVNWGKGKHFVTYNGVICNLINKNVNPWYAYYQLLNKDLNSMAKNSSQPFVSYKELNKVQIPIPPLKIQKEIVRILDTFTELTAELTAELTSELTARKQQYEYYREQLLTFGESKVEWKSLGEVCELINGKAYKKAELLNEGKYPVLRVGNLFTNNQWYYSDLELDERKYIDDNDLIYAWSASFGPRIWKGGKVIYHYHIWKVEPNYDLITKEYLFYIFEWDKEKLQREHGTGSTMIHVSKSSMEQRKIPVPPLKVQKEIVRILDTFTEHTAELTAELTTELAARKQQYEYYRNKLLTFPKDIKQA